MTYGYDEIIGDFSSYAAAQNWAAQNGVAPGDYHIRSYADGTVSLSVKRGAGGDRELTDNDRYNGFFR